MIEIIYILVGILVLYSTIHFAIIQHGKSWKQRSTYEKVVSVIGLIFIGLVYLDAMIA